jgi:uncharacterized protein YecT (DUF1311 family)
MNSRDWRGFTYGKTIGTPVTTREPKKALQESQKAWLKFKNLEFEFIPQYFQDPGSYQGPAIAEQKMDIVRAMALELKAYYDTTMAGRTK